MVFALDTAPFDVLHLICTAFLEKPETKRRELAALASTSKRVRAVALPLLLRSVSISFDEPPKEDNAEGVQIIDRILREMAENSAVQRYAQSFEFSPCPTDNASVLYYCPALILLLKSMAQLRKFKFETLIGPDEGEDYALIQNFFVDPEQTPRFQLKTVTSLSIDEYAVFLLAVCPEVNNLSLEILHRGLDSNLPSPTSPIAWSFADTVHYLQLPHISGSWESAVEHGPEFCQEISKRMPNVSTLVIETIHDAESVMPSFGGFSNLETLVIPDLDTLGLTFYGGWCGTPWRRPGGQERRQQLEAEAIEKGRRQLLTLARNVFPRLRRLWIGRDEMCDIPHLRGRDELENVGFHNIPFNPTWSDACR